MKKTKKQAGPPVFDVSRESCRKIFDAIGDPVFITGIKNGEIIEINESALGYLKATREEILGKNFVELGWWPSAARRKEFVRLLDPMGGITKKEMTFQKDGREYFFILSARYILFNKEKALFVHLKDVTRERRKEQALKESESRLKEAERIAGLGHWKFVPKGQGLVWSDENFRLLGYCPGEVKPSRQKFIDRVHPDDRKRVNEAFDEAIRNGQRFYEIVFRVLHPNGEMRFLKKRVHLSFNNGSLKEAIGIVQDVTKEYESNLKILQSERRWRETFNAIDVSLMLLDQEQNILLANDATTRYLGMDITDIQGHKCYKLMHADGKIPDDCPFQWTCRIKRSQRKEVYIPEREKTFLVVTSPVLDSRGNIEYVIHLAHDVTILKKTEAMLRHAQKMEALGTLAGGIAHDFNNILTGTMGFHELALMPGTDPEKIRIYIENSLKLLRRSAELVKQILAFSRQEEKAEGPVVLNVLIEEMIQMIRASIPPGIEIDYDLPGQDVAVSASAADMHQVIMNLCTNAYQAMKEAGGRLTIRLESVKELPDSLLELEENNGLMEQGEWAHIQVIDTGCGISPKIKERIFEPYFTTKGPGEGTGLGLSLVHSIIKQYKGRISLKSTLGKGTTFDVFLPVSEETPRAVKMTDTGEREEGRGRIMIVDDEQAIVSLLSVFLKDVGYNVETFTCALSALEAFKQAPNQVDIIITDLAMPKMSGAELVKEIRSIRSDIPVIMLTGLLSPDGQKAIKECGPDMVLKKPLNLKALNRGIQGLLAG